MDRNSIYETALKLYKQYKEDGCMTIPDPVNWIFNKNKMILMWDNYKETFKQDCVFNNLMLDNSLTKYMTFMIEHYGDYELKIIHKNDLQTKR